MSRRHCSKPPLWLALRFPHLPLSVAGYDYNSATAVIISHKRRAYQFNALALAAGVTQGMPLSTAQAISDGTILEREPGREQEALQQIAEICYAFTPYIEFYGEHSLLLEVSRSLELFRGIKNLTQRLFKALGQQPHHYCYGLAHTGKAAWLLSWQNHPINAGDSENIFQQRLAQVPINHLHEFPEVAVALQKSGFTTLGDLMVQMQADNKAASSAAIRKRFGKDFTVHLEEIFGSNALPAQGQLFNRPTPTYQPADDFQETIQFDYPISNSEQLRDPMQQLLESLIHYLVAKQQQCHSIQWHLYDIHQNQQTIIVNSERIHSQWQLPLDLTMIQLEHIELPFEVDSIELTCSQLVPIETRNHNLLEQHLSHHLSADSERLFARLSARLGKQALSKISYCDSDLPEDCQQQIAVTEMSQTQLPPQHLNAPRPTWLFTPPQVIQQKQQQLFWHGVLKLVQGPERLQGHWWNTPNARDYFMAQRDDHLRCWVYQDLKSQEWYVHGVFA